MPYERENKQMIRWLKNKSPDTRHFVAMHLNWDFAEPTLDWIVGRRGIVTSHPQLNYSGKPILASYCYTRIGRQLSLLRSIMCGRLIS